MENFHDVILHCGSCIATVTFTMDFSGLTLYYMSDFNLHCQNGPSAANVALMANSETIRKKKKSQVITNISE